MHAVSDPVMLPPWAWERAEVRHALLTRDIGEVFRAVQKYSGASQARIAAATGLSQARVNEVINGRREVTRLDVFERIADGLAVPDDARRILGLAPARARTDRDSANLAAFPEVARVYEDQDAARSEIATLAETATRIDVLAVRGLGLLGLNDSLLRTRLDRGTVCTLRVLLLDPDSPATATRAAEVGESVESFAAGIRMTLSRLSGQPGVTVCLYDQVPVWRVIRLDDVMFVSTFDTWEGHESAMYKIIGTARGPLHRGLARHIEALVTRAEEARTP